VTKSYQWSQVQYFDVSDLSLHYSIVLRREKQETIRSAGCPLRFALNPGCKEPRCSTRSKDTRLKGACLRWYDSLRGQADCGNRHDGGTNRVYQLLLIDRALHIASHSTVSPRQQFRSSPSVIISLLQPTALSPTTNSIPRISARHSPLASLHLYSVANT
jgi:hypothetical protein